MPPAQCVFEGMSTVTNVGWSAFLQGVNLEVPLQAVKANTSMPSAQFSRGEDFSFQSATSVEVSQTGREEILASFAEKFLKNMVPPDPKIEKIIEENFWDLV